MGSEDCALSFKIGLDLHGVIDENPEFFSAFTKALSICSIEVHILTGPSAKDVEKQLSDYDIWYSKLFSIRDHHEVAGTAMTYDENGDPWMSDYDWDKTKAEYCAKEGIDLHIDDSDKYQYFFSTPYARYLSKNKRKYYRKK